MRTLWLALFLVFSPVLASAEYRVFLLRIETPATEPGQPPTVTAIESTLDPDQYRTYNSVPANAVIQYTDTWRCYGRTSDFKPHCPSPRAPASDPADGAALPAATPPAPQT